MWCCRYCVIRGVKEDVHTCLIILPMQLPSDEWKRCVYCWIYPSEWEMFFLWISKAQQEHFQLNSQQLWLFVLHPDSLIHLVVQVPDSQSLCFFGQGGQWLPWRHAARLGHRDRSVFTRPHGPRGGSPLRPVWRAAGGQRCLRLHGQSVGPRDGDLPPHAAGPHQQSVLVTGEQLQTHIVQVISFI